MPNAEPRPLARLSLEQLRKQAKDLLRAYRAGEVSARKRAAEAMPHPAVRSFSLADAQFVIARESGFDSWTQLKRHIEESWRCRIAPYQQFAADLAATFQSDDAAPLAHIHEFLGRTPAVEQIRAHVLRRLSIAAGRPVGDGALSLDDAKLFVAKFFGFTAWADLESAVTRPASTRRAVHGVSTTPPFYRIHWKDNCIEPRPPLSAEGWEQIFEVMREKRITGLRPGWLMTDEVLERVAELDLVTSLDLSDSGRVTDEGLRHLAKMPRLEALNLTGCDITDQGLAVMRHLPTLREFYLLHHHGISDAGLANLASCEQLERVDLLGSSAGDGAIRALAGKTRLRYFKSGNLLTDSGLALLRQIPHFRAWQGGAPEMSLMSFDAQPNFLLLRGSISDAGLRNLAQLEGVFALNLDDSNLAISASGARVLAALPHLEWLAFDADDETMSAIAGLPHLRTLMCQDTRASDDGFIALSRSRTLEYLWGRRCHGLTGRGFSAIARMPALRGLSVSCRNVDDAALARLPELPSLVEFMPMDVPDHGFRHVGRCVRLEAVWCMYCRDTGDAATAHLAGLPRLKTYYAGQTQITDRSLEMLSGVESLERVILSACPALTNAGVTKLVSLPRLSELGLEYLPGLSRDVLRSIPARVRVNFEM
jgi:hypothetical protein